MLPFLASRGERARVSALPTRQNRTLPYPFNQLALLWFLQFPAIYGMNYYPG